MLKQTIKTEVEGTWEIIGIRQSTDTKGIWSASVTWHCVDSEGNIIDRKEIEYYGEAYNEFWEKYVNGAYLFSELIKTLGITATIPEDIEDSFVNKTENEI